MAAKVAGGVTWALIPQRRNEWLERNREFSRFAVMILVHASPKTLEPYRTENLGVLCSPRCVYADDIEKWPWAADNDAFSKWDEGRYRDMLDRIEGPRVSLRDCSRSSRRR